MELLTYDIFGTVDQPKASMKVGKDLTGIMGWNMHFRRKICSQHSSRKNKRKKEKEYVAITTYVN